MAQVHTAMKKQVRRADSSPKKRYKWPINRCSDAQPYLKLQKYKLNYDDFLFLTLQIGKSKCLLMYFIGYGKTDTVTKLCNSCEGQVAISITIKMHLRLNPPSHF